MIIQQWCDERGNRRYREIGRDIRDEYQREIPIPDQRRKQKRERQREKNSWLGFSPSGDRKEKAER